MHVLAYMLRRGTASTHAVDLSMAVNRYTWPSEEAGRGPTRSTCTWENLQSCMQGLGWHGVELLAACRPFHSGTAGSRCTMCAHSCHVFAHTLTDKMSSHHMLGGTYARVGHAEDGVEKLQL